MRACGAPSGVCGCGISLHRIVIQPQLDASQRRGWRGGNQQPSKNLHELRVGELARLDEIPHTTYCGTLNAT
jgi:hypothetical protein